jgi:hypothetical protein
MSSNDLWSIQRGDRQTDKTAAFRSTFASVCPEPVLTSDLFSTKKQHRTPAKKALFPAPSVQPKRKAACFSAFFSPAHRIVEGGASIILTSSTAQQGRASKNERGGRLKIERARWSPQNRITKTVGTSKCVPMCIISRQLARCISRQLASRRTSS